MEACGFSNIASVVPSKFFRRINEKETESFEKIYFSQQQVVEKKVLLAI